MAEERGRLVEGEGSALWHLGIRKLVPYGNSLMATA